MLSWYDKKVFPKWLRQTLVISQFTFSRIFQNFVSGGGPVDA